MGDSFRCKWPRHNNQMLDILGRIRKTEYDQDIREYLKIINVTRYNNGIISM